MSDTWNDEEVEPGLESGTDEDDLDEDELDLDDDEWDEDGDEGED